MVVTPALIALNTITFLLMAAGSGTLANPDTLLSWGGSFGPSTSNGEWWRLVTSMFVHAGFFSLLIDLIALAQLGWLLERMAGPITLAATYLGAGLFAALVNLSAHPIDVHVGATAAVLGLFGLLVATIAWSLFHRSEPVMPIATLKPLAPAAGILLLYVLGGGLDRTAALVAFGSGLVGGLVLTRGIGEHKPPVRRLAVTVAGTLAIAVAAAVPLRGLALVKPEIAHVVDVEQRTASTYEKAVRVSRRAHQSGCARAAHRTQHRPRTARDAHPGSGDRAHSTRTTAARRRRHRVLAAARGELAGQGPRTALIEHGHASRCRSSRVRRAAGIPQNHAGGSAMSARHGARAGGSQMFRHATAVIVAALSLGSSAAFAQNAELTVKVVSAEVHQTPSVGSPVIGKAPRGAVLEVTREVGDWVKVSWPDDKSGAGYVHLSNGSLGHRAASQAAAAPLKIRLRRSRPARVRGFRDVARA